MGNEKLLLGAHVAARRHVVTSPGPTRATFVALHDRGDRGPRTLRVGAREWTLLEGMDGTRDVSGLVAFAALRGVAIGVEHAEAFVRELLSEGLVVDASAAPSATRRPSAEGSSHEEARAPKGEGRARDGTRNLEALPGYRLRCDGRGSCCRLYPTVLFSPLDAARARAASPETLDGGEDEAKVFTAESGASREALAVALVDGRCAYLGPKGLCDVHAKAGADAKPFGCRSFPVALVDDGVAVRVTPAIECACVVSSAIDGEPGGEPLLDPRVTTASELDPRLYVDTLPEVIAISANASLARADYVALSRSIEATPVANAAAAFAALASACASGSLSTACAREALAAVEVDGDERARVAAHLEALRGRIAGRATESWRGEAALAYRAFVAIGAAIDVAQQALEELLEPSPRTAAEESFYVRAGLFGHHFVSRSLRRPLDATFIDRATRVVVARALAVVAAMTDLDDPAFASPLSLVEATLRGHGLVTYALDVAPP